MALELMTETLRRAQLKVLAASFEEARERFRPERLALHVPLFTSEQEIAKSYGYSVPSEQVNWKLIRQAIHSGRTEMESTPDRFLLAVPAMMPGGAGAAAVYFFDLPLARAVFVRDELFSMEALFGRAAAETALLVRRLLVPRERVLPMPDQVDTWTGVRRAGLEAFKAGVHEMALSFLERARDMAEEWGPCPELATSLNDYGEILRANDCKEDAFQQFQRGISVLEQAGMDADSLAVPLLNNYAGMLYTQRELEEAESFYRRALNIMTGQRQESKATPAILSNLGVISVELGDRAAAEAWLSQALISATRLWGDEHPNTVKCRQKLEALRAS